MVLSILAIIFLALYGALFRFYKKGWLSLEEVNSAGGIYHDNLPRITVVVAARNEANHITHLLSALTKQTYRRDLFEIIIASDHSTDNTKELALSFQHVHVVDLSTGEAGKKKAIALAIAHATGELIVATDADCLPGPFWLATVADHYIATKAAFIAAPVVYKTDRSLLSIFQTIDFITLQGITAAGVATGFHSMCNGANLAYRKEIFEEVKGFEGIDNIASGDDLLLMHKISRRYPQRVHYLKSIAASVLTKPPETWKAFFSQRIRWASKSAHYDDKRIFYALLLVYLLNLFFLVILFLSCFHWQYLFLALGFLLVKTWIEIDFIKPVAKFFRQEQLLRWFPLLQPLHIFYTVAVGLLSQFGKYEWKGRKTK